MQIGQSLQPSFRKYAAILRVTALQGLLKFYFIIIIFYGMAVPCREQISFTSAFISLLFLFSFRNKNVLFCFESKNKKNLLPVNEKQNNFKFFFRFIFTK